MLEFFDLNNKNGLASIYDSHITFNKGSLKYFDDCYKVRVGVDNDTKEMYVFILNKDAALSGEYSESSLLSVSVSKSYARVCSSDLIEYIKNIFGLVIEKGSFLKFKTLYDSIKKAIVIKMKEEVK